MIAGNEKGTSRGAPAATILIVEDSPVQVELLRRTLEQAGYQVIAATNGAEGLSLARAHRPDVVISDINMPLMDGYRMCEAIRDEPMLKATPVILLTMLSDPEDVIRGLKAGADAYLTKPYNIPSLISRIESLLAHPPVPPPGQERRKVSIRLAGHTHTVDAHGPRILSLLVSTYENAVLQNRELAATQQALEDLNQHLEQRVLEQTAALRQSEQRFRSLIENASDLVTVIDTHGAIAYASPSIKRLAGYEADEVRGRSFLEFVHPVDLPAAAAVLEQALGDPGVLHPSEFRTRHKDGHTVTLESIARNAIADPATQGIVVNSRDISERKRAETDLRRLNRALTTINACNEALIRSSGEAQLLDEVCALLVTQGGFSRAWVAEFSDEGPPFRRLAQAGTDDGFQAAVDASIDRSAEGGAPLADTARRTGKPVVCNDIATDPAFPRWRAEALKRGFASNIALPLMTNGTAFGILSIYANEIGVFDDNEVKLLVELAGDLAYGIVARRTRVERDEAWRERELHQERLRKSLEDSVEVVAATIEARDPYTAGHQRRVADLAVAIAQVLGLEAEQIAGLRLGGIVHDLGKIHVPAEILSKPGKLTNVEFDLIRQHPAAGFEILKGIEFPWPIAQIVLQHHERLDGSGYPQGLKGDQIVLEAKILAVADVVEAMASHRPYRPGTGIDKAIDEISAGRGKHFEPTIVDACVKLFKEKGYELSR
ncbi:MAG: response regulator [Betaproteobacteria bacterium]|nr:response regulator [Betaproteobacteria bacterium]